MFDYAPELQRRVPARRLRFVVANSLLILVEMAASFAIFDLLEDWPFRIPDGLRPRSNCCLGERTVDEQSFIVSADFAYP